ncbi:MAG: hypothetical protein V4490_04380 [Pseudomonadota bacterium]
MPDRSNGSPTLKVVNRVNSVEHPITTAPHSIKANPTKSGQLNEWNKPTLFFSENNVGKGTESFNFRSGLKSTPS